MSGPSVGEPGRPGCGREEDVLVEDAWVQDAEGQSAAEPVCVQRTGSMAPGLAVQGPGAPGLGVLDGQVTGTPESGCSQRKVPEGSEKACAGARWGLVLAVSERSSSRMPGMCFPPTSRTCLRCPRGGQGLPTTLALDPAGRGRIPCRARTPRRVPPAVIPAAQQACFITGRGGLVWLPQLQAQGGRQRGTRTEVAIGHGSGHKQEQPAPVPERALGSGAWPLWWPPVTQPRTTCRHLGSLGTRGRGAG